MKCKTYKLKDICSIKSGKRIPLGMDYTTDVTNYPYIRARDIKGGKILTDDLIYLEEKVYEKIKKYIISKDDIAITIVGASVGDVGYAQEEVDGYNLTENAVRLTNFKYYVNSKYVFYLICQKQYRDYMQTIASGAAQPKLGIYKVEKIKIQLPEIELQNKIVGCLSQYDDLIGINKSRISLLEQMAENLYKEWFVRFRFPDYMNVKTIESRIGKIPESFNVVKMQDIVESYIGGGWGSDEEDKDFSQPAFVIRGADFPNISRGDISTCPFRYHKQSNYKARELQEDDIIIEVSGGTAEQPVGRMVIVTKDIIERLDNHVICASFCKQVRIKKKIVEPLYFYYWMQFMYDTRMIDRFQLQSTGILNFKFEYFLRKGDVMIPTEPLMQEFVRIVKPIREEMSLLAKRNDNLIKQRDLLLPRLMSGKLEVK